MITITDKIKEYFLDDDLMYLGEQYNDAILGVSDDFNAPPRVVYSAKKCIDILNKEMQYDDAVEFFFVNLKGSYVGEKTPVYILDYMM